MSNNCLNCNNYCDGKGVHVDYCKSLRELNPKGCGNLFKPKKMI